VCFHLFYSIVRSVPLRSSNYSVLQLLLSASAYVLFLALSPRHIQITFQPIIRPCIALIGGTKLSVFVVFCCTYKVTIRPFINICKLNRYSPISTCISRKCSSLYAIYICVWCKDVYVGLRRPG